MTLYELTNDFSSLYDMYDDEDIDSECWFDTLDGIEQQIEDKAENIACLIKNIQADSKAFKEEEDRIKKKRMSADKRVDSLKNYLTSALEQVNLDKVKGIRASITKCKGRESIVIDDETAFAEAFPEYCEAVITYKIDKDKLKKAIQSGEVFPNVRIETKPYVLIK